MYSFSTSFWTVAAQFLGRHALFLADQLVEQQQDRGGRVDRHRGGDAVERDLVEADPHVLDRVDRHPGPPHLAEAERVVGVATQLGRQVEGHREAGRAVLDQVAVALVGVLRRGEARVLAHRPEPVAVHPLVDAAGEGRRAGLTEPLLEAGCDVALVIESVDLDAGIGEDALVIGADQRRDRAVRFLGGVVGGGRHALERILRTATGGRQPGDPQPGRRRKRGDSGRKAAEEKVANDHIKSGEALGSFNFTAIGE